MKVRANGLARLTAIVIALMLEPANAQSWRDFIFTDDEGHLILRFVGNPSGEPSPTQMEEVHSAEVSVMVHDRMRADVLFESEIVDSTWALSMESRLGQHFARVESPFTSVESECRSQSCRLYVDHPDGRNVREHQSLMSLLETPVRSFIDSNPGSIDSVFLIAGYYQEPAAPYIKVYLRRTMPAAATDGAAQSTRAQRSSR